MRRVVSRVLPDGTIGNVQPFHICLEGLEKAVLCRDEKDYDAFVKIICLAAWRKNVIVVIYTVVSNHSHATVLARCQEDADGYGEEGKDGVDVGVRSIRGTQAPSQNRHEGTLPGQ